VRLAKAPLDLTAKGTLEVALRPQGRTIQGVLQPVSGKLSLGGQDHAYAKGNIVFDEAHPQGWMDLHFQRELPKATQRDIAMASRGDSVKISMVGPVGSQVTTLDGAGSPGSLFDLLAVHNTGAVRYRSAPDLPATAATQFPQYNNLLMLGFLGSNIPHLLFLDKFTVWSNPYDARDAYGRLEHAEGEVYSSDGRTRVRAVRHPRRAGQSQGELQWDRLFVNTKQSVSGVGLSVGTRGGGGPSVFYEWSSED
jgi:hypothetical protein